MVRECRGRGHSVLALRREKLDITNAKAVLETIERYTPDWVINAAAYNKVDLAETEPEVSAEQLIELARHPKVVGFGETGLDFFYEHSPRDVQERFFRAHIEAARETGLPVIVHTRDADEDMTRILRDEYDKGAFPGLIHCFSSGPELAETVLEIGFSISFSGIVTFKKADEIRAVAETAPLDRILVETDSPYLAPMPKRGKRNEPAFTAFTAARVAELRGLDEKSFSEATTDNFFRLFSKAEALRS